MVEQIDIKCLKKQSIPGSGVYYSSTACNPKLFFKKPAIKGSAIVEALISTYLGYIDEVKEFGYADYFLCKIGDAYANYTKLIQGLEDIVPILAKNSNLFNPKYKSRYNDIVDYLCDRDIDSKTEVKDKYEEICRVLSVITGLQVSYIERYFRVLTIIDFLVSNGDRSFDNVFLLNTKDGLVLSPYLDFGNSLCCFGKSCSNVSSGPFSKHQKVQLDAVEAFNNPLTMDFDGFMNYIQGFKVNDLFQMRIFTCSLAMLKETCEKWKGKLWIQK